MSTILTDILQFCSNADAAPAALGAYIFQIDLADTVFAPSSWPKPRREFAMSGLPPKAHIAEHHRDVR